MANYCPIVIIFILTLGCLALIIVLPLTASPHIPPTKALAFESGLPDYQYQQHVCPCKDDWPLATDERNISDAFFNQPLFIEEPRGLSNIAWGILQLFDHDVVGSETNTSDGYFTLHNFNLTRVQHRMVGNCREPKNFISPMIDGTPIYGDYLNLNLKLRDNGRCNLKMSEGNLLPIVNSKTFLAGDARNTEHSLLASLHTLWAREHNRLCDELLQLQPGWTEEERFWKARQVVVAKLQHILYEECLPALFGSHIGLLESVPEKGTGLRITAEFATVAYRFGHSMVSNQLGGFQLKDMFFNVAMLQNNGIEPFLKAAAYEPAQKVDARVVDGLRNILFGDTVREDLVTRNLFTGRSNTMGTYKMITDCYSTYTYNDHKDPFLGMLSEPLPSSETSLPVTIATIVAEQFGRLRRHDPFFYTKRTEEIGKYFMKEIQKTTLADVIRKNTNLKDFKDEAFYVKPQQ